MILHPEEDNINIVFFGRNLFFFTNSSLLDLYLV